MRNMPVPGNELILKIVLIFQQVIWIQNHDQNHNQTATRPRNRALQLGLFKALPLLAV